jgi:hypothetical protein
MVGLVARPRATADLVAHLLATEVRTAAMAEATAVAVTRVRRAAVDILQVAVAAGTRLEVEVATLVVAAEVTPAVVIAKAPDLAATSARKRTS